ncbi:MAG: hypothetical protein H6849_03960 [Alphaproteobacteria bacterium]|nr:MAG: hypothetical protein H6849_03960 [Alphaproteobacteria bacterium]
MNKKILKVLTLSFVFTSASHCDAAWNPFAKKKPASTRQLVRKPSGSFAQNRQLARQPSGSVMQQSSGQGPIHSNYVVPPKLEIKHMETPTLPGGIREAYTMYPTLPTMPLQGLNLAKAIQHAQQHPSVTSKTSRAACSTKFRSWGAKKEKLPLALKSCDPHQIKNYLNALLKSKQVTEGMLLPKIIMYYNNRISNFNRMVENKNKAAYTAAINSAKQQAEQIAETMRARQSAIEQKKKEQQEMQDLAAQNNQIIREKHEGLGLDNFQDFGGFDDFQDFGGSDVGSVDNNEWGGSNIPEFGSPDASDIGNFDDLNSFDNSGGYEPATDAEGSGAENLGVYDWM